MANNTILGLDRRLELIINDIYKSFPFLSYFDFMFYTFFLISGIIALFRKLPKFISIVTIIIVLFRVLFQIVYIFYIQTK